MKKFNQYHLVSNSPWPFFTSMVFLSFALSVIIMVRYFHCLEFISSLIMLLLSSFFWGKDIHRESCIEGEHYAKILDGFKLGMILFILSECFFFGGMFWSYLHLAQSPAIELGMLWPPKGIICFDPVGIPFLNTIILVSSGVSVTWCHHSMEIGSLNYSIISLMLTLLLGINFTMFQLMEYFVALFTFSCSSYSSIYFMGTGFHGLHVIIGSGLLFLSFFRFKELYISPNHSTGFECAVWYWHFVDIVWFFLYLIFYWWGI